jgi:prepilin-type N-terminal cleavage/methylation domain-containing protein
MFRRTKKGFTLVEIMIVVAIIALLAAMAIPNLLRSRLQAQETAAVSALHTLVAAQTSWRAFNSAYASLAELGPTNSNPPYIDSTLEAAVDATHTKNGYYFTVTPNANDFMVYAVHAAGQGRNFYVDEGGVVCRAASTEGAPAHMGGQCTGSWEQVD